MDHISARCVLIGNHAPRAFVQVVQRCAANRSNRTLAHQTGPAKSVDPMINFFTSFLIYILFSIYSSYLLKSPFNSFIF